MKCIAGAEVPTAGQDQLRRQRHHRVTPTERARAGMSLKFQITSVLPSLSRLRQHPARAAGAVLAARLMFSRTRGAAARAGHGHADAVPPGRSRRRTAGCAVARRAAMAGDRDGAGGEPKLLLLDEPTGGMSLEERRVTGELLQPIKQRCSLVIVEHDLDFIRDICDVLTVLDQGSVLDIGTVSSDPGQQKGPGGLSAPVPEILSSTSQQSRAGYGRSQVLFDVTSRIPRRGRRRRARAQRRGQDHADENHRRRAAGVAGRSRSTGATYAHADRASAYGRHRLRAAGACGVRPAVGA